MSARPRIFYGWWVVWTFCFLGFYWTGVLLTGFSALFTPLKESFGLSTTVTTLVINLRQAAAVVVSPVVGYLFDKVGPRPLVVAASVLSAAGLCLVASAQEAWQFFLAFPVVAVGVSIFLAGVGPASAANWFVRDRGKAVSIVLAGAGAGVFILPAIVWMEQAWGWRTTMYAMAGGMLAIGLPSAMIARHRPEQYGLRPDGDPVLAAPAGATSAAATPASQPIAGTSFRFAMQSQAFWLLVLAGGVSALSSSSVLLFLVPHMKDKGFGASSITATATALGIIGVTSTLASGWLADKLESRLMVIVAHMCVGAGTIVFAFSSATWHLIPFSILFGFGQRGAYPFVFSLLTDYFGRANFGRIQGMVFGILTGFQMAGPLIAAAVEDWTGSFTTVLIVYGIAAGSVSVVAITLVRRPPPMPEVRMA